MKNRGFQRETAVDGVLEVIRDEIQQGVYPPGSQLKQSAIAESFGVSQGIVREALSRLSEKGLVETIPYRGMFVTRLTKKDIQEIYHMRRALESLALHLGAEKLRDQQSIQHLVEYTDKIRRAVEVEDKDAAVFADLNFHNYLVEASDNSRLIKAWTSLFSQAFFTMLELYSVGPVDKNIELANNHLDIVTAIQGGDLDDMDRAIEVHMAIAVDALATNPSFLEA